MLTPSHPHIRRTVGAVSACLLSATAWAADDSARIRAIVDAAIEPVMAEHGLPGMAVAVTAGGKAYVYHYGVASKKGHVPVGGATLFELGSVSKPFTATLASYAQALGKLSWDDHPGKYVPELKGHAIDKATLLHLGTYTAGGLPLQFPEKLADAGTVGYFQQWKADAAPGEQRRYSNPSLGLFGHAAARAMGADFADIMEQQVLPQLGIRNSYIRIPAAAMDHYAWGEDDAGQPARMRPGPFGMQSYGLVATAGDVLRLVQANIDPSQLKEPMRRAVQGTQRGYFAVGPMVQGLGWEQYPWPVKVEQVVAGNSTKISWEPNVARRIEVAGEARQAILFNKTGSTRGFSNYVAFVPRERIGIVMLANKGYPSEVRVRTAHAILQQLATP